MHGNRNLSSHCFTVSAGRLVFVFVPFSTDFVRHQSIPIQSMSADIFSFKEDIYVAMAAPNTNSCVVMEWDHIEMNFRKLDNITGLEPHTHSMFRICLMIICIVYYALFSCKILLKSWNWQPIDPTHRFYLLSAEAVNTAESTTSVLIDYCYL